MLGEFPTTTGELKAEMAKFERRLTAWLPKWREPTIRVALIVQARTPAQSVAAAYEILRDNLTSVAVMPGAMSDLIYRVNWKAKTAATVEGYLNRLTTWSALQFRVIANSSPDGAPEIELKVRD